MEELVWRKPYCESCNNEGLSYVQIVSVYFVWFSGANV